jgi:hypothetical protein
MGKSQVSFSDSIDKMISNIPKKGMPDWHREQMAFMQNQEKESKEVEDDVLQDNYSPENSSSFIAENNLRFPDLATSNMLSEIIDKKAAIKHGAQTHHIVVCKKLKYMVEEIILKLNNESIENDQRFKKISVRDFFEVAAYEYLEKFKNQ